MHLFSLSFLFLFTPLINANGADILNAISKISNATIALNKTVTSFPNNALLGLTDIVPLLIDSGSLLHDINEATDVANASANLTIAEAVCLPPHQLSREAIVLLGRKKRTNKRNRQKLPKLLLRWVLLSSRVWPQLCLRNRSLISC